MIAKIAIFLGVVAFAYGGVVVSGVASGVVGVPHSPASTVKLANVVPQVVTYAAAPQIIAQPQVIAQAPITYAAQPVVAQQIVHQAPIAYAAPGHQIITGQVVQQVHEPVEQHGYKIAY